MPIFGWIRDALGIRKDYVDTKRAQLEIKKLEDAQREKLITPATLDDVKKYDPKFKKLIEKVTGEILGGTGVSTKIGNALILITLLIIGWQLAGWLAKWLSR